MRSRRRGRRPRWPGRPRTPRTGRAPRRSRPCRPAGGRPTPGGGPPPLPPASPQVRQLQEQAEEEELLGGVADKVLGRRLEGGEAVDEPGRVAAVGQGVAVAAGEGGQPEEDLLTAQGPDLAPVPGDELGDEAPAQAVAVDLLLEGRLFLARAGRRAAPGRRRCGPGGRRRGRRPGPRCRRGGRAQPARRRAGAAEVGVGGQEAGAGEVARRGFGGLLGPVRGRRPRPPGAR